MKTREELLAELKPCPFCGSRAEFGVIPLDRKCAGEDDCQINHDFGGEFIQCSNNNCAASSMLIFPTMEDAKPFLLEKWNLRAQVVVEGVTPVYDFNGYPLMAQ